MAQGQRLSDEKRAQVIALLLTGESLARTAKLSGVSVKTVERIKSSPQMAELVALKRESEPSIRELVTAHLTTALEAANALARSIRDDKEWFARQSAYDIAMLYGTLSDKAIRIYAAKLQSEKLELERREP
jgi:hypothetical protein